MVVVEGWRGRGGAHLSEYPKYGDPENEDNATPDPDPGESQDKGNHVEESRQGRQSGYDLGKDLQ